MKIPPRGRGRTGLPQPIQETVEPKVKRTRQIRESCFLWVVVTDLRVPPPARGGGEGTEPRVDTERGRGFELQRGGSQGSLGRQGGRPDGVAPGLEAGRRARGLCHGESWELRRPS